MILDRISEPKDIVSLTIEEKVILASEIRSRIIDVICKSGGHLAASLGVVELTIALLSFFEPPFDKIIWDVGHQIYPYKLLTDRKDRFHTIRQRGGLSGFPRRDESRYDVFGTGHSSTAISAALGFALARDHFGSGEKIVAVVGDGAMTGGMALEGLNHLGHSGSDMLIVLNDNRMSISKNVGAMSRYLTKLITDPMYNRFRNEIWNVLGRIPSFGERMRKAAHVVGESIKNLITPGTFFDDFGIRYIGPVPGNDLPTLCGVFDRIYMIRGPVLLHVVTTKGKGFQPAEDDASSYHGISGSVKSHSLQPAFTEVFSKKIIELAGKNEKIVAITAAMPSGTGLDRFASEFPDRFFDVGIAEQHAITLACSLAFGGLKPVVAIYSTFIQRALDQVIHDAALQKAPVTIVLDRSGPVGEDGPTHHGVFDIPLLRSIPNVKFASPRDAEMLKRILEMIMDLEDGPNLIRFPRQAVPETDITPQKDIKPGFGQFLTGEGGEILLTGLGVMTACCIEAAEILAKEGIETSVFDPVWIKPFPVDQLKDAARNVKLIVTVEDGCLEGGFGELVVSQLRDESCHIINLGIPDSFQPHGSRSELLSELGVDSFGIVSIVRKWYADLLKNGGEN